ncbi:intermediate filament protein [Scheffersomyces coipomensis]|uniref:intermediate filament protein n=1 Tax=Scheffersomyces coipomensis TaxID=1788519 RepID=UPI00315CDD88
MPSLATSSLNKIDFHRFIREGGWYILCGFILIYIIRRVYTYLLTLILGSCISVGLLVYVIVTTRGEYKTNIISRRNGRFKFTVVDNWQQQTSALTVNSKDLIDPIFNESIEISELFETFIDLILNDFINSWFTSVSSNTLFQESVSLEVKLLLQTFQKKLQDIDFAKLLVTHILPILNEHFTRYIKAEDLVKSNNTKADSQEFHRLVAQNYDRGKIHQAVTLSTTGESDLNEKKYLRSKVAEIIPQLLSEKESKNEVSIAFLTEIVACTILTNVFRLLSEADFYNMLIVNLIGDNLKHRDQVKQLLAALEVHTKQLSSKASINFQKLQEFEDSNKAYTITKNMDTGTYRELLKSVNTIDSNPIISHKTTTTENVKLYDILNNSHLLKLFQEFMSYRDRSEFLDFWLEVESIKAPLEDSTIGENGESNLSLSLEFTSLSDIKDIYSNYTSLDIFDDTDVDVVNFKTITSSNQDSLESYSKARKLLFKFQNKVYKEMEDNDFVKFKSSTSFSKIITNITNDTIAEEVNPDVIQAVENAFSEIMSKPRESANVNEFNYDQNKSSSSSSLIYFSDSEKSQTSHKKELFGESSTLFGNDAADAAHFRGSKLFDDSSDESDNDSDALSFQNDSQTLEGSEIDAKVVDEENVISSDQVGSSAQVFVAAPGNLNLAEEIPKLTEEIEKLNEQVIILTPLLRKAELTNNVGDLKILSRSMVSLEREINSKELQKQQYIVQENDNSLYGKSRVCIQSYISGNENGKEFILYIIEVQKFDSNDPNVVKAGWVVARRFSQFYKLHEYLKSRYPNQVGLIKFPRKTVLKFQQRQIVELRKIALEEYLQQLINLPQVCSDIAFRSFLSSENFSIHKSTLDESMKSGKSKSYVESVANRLYNGISSRIVPNITITKENDNVTHTNVGGAEGKGNIVNPNQEQVMKNIIDMQQELKSFDEYGTTNTGIFVKPICDILISVFRLNNSKSWLRGRALIVILQQIFGTTIEKKVYEQIDQQLKTEQSLLNIMGWLQNTLFPNGKFKDPPPIRTYYQQSSTRQEAKVLLGLFMNETCAKIFGTSNTAFATSKIFSMLQNEYLTKHLIFEVFDELVKEIFPLEK